MTYPCLGMEHETDTADTHVGMDDETRNALQLKYIDEMSLPSEVTDFEWAEANGISDRTLRRWKQTQAFKDKQRTRLSETYFSPTKIGQVMANAFKIASTEQGPHAVQAMRMYMDQVNKIAPLEVLDQSTDVGDFRAMTVEELEAAAKAAQ